MHTTTPWQRGLPPRFLLLVLALGLATRGLSELRSTDAYLDESAPQWEAIAQKIWEAPELALQENKSSALLAQALEKEGFQVTWGAGGEPTAFVATAGSGSPVIAFLAEYDALPGLSQAGGVAKAQPLVPDGPGHGCGHNLLGTASTAAAVAANRERIARHLTGTIKLFGTPAEEVLFGKTFMIRDGAFAGVDMALAWHPDDQNRVVNRTRLAAAAFDVEFFGRAAHAAAAPWLGRSSLDALMLFDHAMALMREHIKPTARIHRVVIKGGAAANIIPDYTKGQYWLRDVNGASVNELAGWMRKAAEGAALGTETRVKVTTLFSVRDPLAIDSLNRAMQKELERVGAPAFDAADLEFARSIQRELAAYPAGLAQQTMPYTVPNGGTASSDIGEVGGVVPLAELGVAVRPIGTAAHHWAQTSCAASPLGRKGMLVAAKTLAATGVDLLSDPQLVQAVKDEFATKTAGKPYVVPLEPGAQPKPIM